VEHLTIPIGSLALLVLVALAFDFMNGFHDGANSISTIVATGALTPKQAVLFAAFFNFAALWIFELRVAATIGKGTVDPALVDHFVIFGALMGALIWNIITWYYGIPSSSSHALVGGLVGATVVKAGGLTPIVWSGFGKILIFIIISPLVGFLIGGLLMVGVAWVFRNRSPYQAGKWFKSGQLFAAAAYSLGHGGNDAQKTIGIIWLLLITTGASRPRTKTLPLWVVYSLLHAPSPGAPPGRLAHRQDHGHRRSPGSNPSAAPARPWAARSAWAWPRWAAFRCPPRTPSPAPSSAWAPRRM
jgi:PiT family inorganic phosphate transporter